MAEEKKKKKKKKKQNSPHNTNTSNHKKILLVYHQPQKKKSLWWRFCNRGCNQVLKPPKKIEKMEISQNDPPQADHRTKNRLNCRKRMMKKVKRELPQIVVKADSPELAGLTSDSDSDDELLQELENAVPYAVDIEPNKACFGPCSHQKQPKLSLSIISHSEYSLEDSLSKLVHEEEQDELDHSLAMQLQRDEEEHNKLIHLSTTHSFHPQLFSNKYSKPPLRGEGMLVHICVLSGIALLITFSSLIATSLSDSLTIFLLYLFSSSTHQI
jgi:hypothetical protein